MRSLKFKYASAQVALLIIGLLFSCSSQQIDIGMSYTGMFEETKPVRVLLLKTKGKAAITSKSKTVIRELNTSKIVFSTDKASLKIAPDMVTSPLLVSSADNILSLNGSAYRGDFEIHRLKDGLYIINAVSMSDYLKGVVPCEMPASWPEEALKAQAVAARTFCVYHLRRAAEKSLYGLDATTGSQVYRGISAEARASSKAVDATEGIIITNANQPIIAYFHSTCGGLTANAKYVWPNSDYGFFEAKNCAYCKDSKHYSWETELTLDAISAALKKKYGGIGRITNISFLKKESRVLQVKIAHKGGDLRLGGNEFRMLISPQALKSLYFSAEKKGNALLIKGHGWGHGVGMCQWGARGMALAGKSYKEITAYYYKDVRLAKINSAKSGKLFSVR